MHRQMQLLQRPQQILQSVRQGDGTGGICQQKRSHNEHHDPQHHVDRRRQALIGDMAQQPPLAHRRAAGEENVHHRRKRHDDIHGLEAPCQGLHGHTGGHDAHRKHRRHNGVGQGALGIKERHDIQDHRHQLRPGIQPVDDGIAGEKLPQRDILQHPSPPPLRASSACSSSSMVYTAGSISMPRLRSAMAIFVTCGTSSPACSSSSARANTCRGVPSI